MIRLSASEMAKAIREKKISPLELLEAHLGQIERLNPRLKAIVNLRAEAARAEARKAERAVMGRRRLGPLHGVPVTIKSSIDVAGLPCEAGSRLRAGHVPETDATLVKRLRRAGAIVLGNTNVPELLMAYESDNLLYGRCSNPWDLERTPGGSSGGEAAAIAACLSAAGIGSDGGGSIRVPAHFCGICGLKPTPGRIPATGHFPPSLGPFALLGVVGPMARAVRDLELLLAVVAGPDPADAASAPVAPPRAKASIRKMRIGYFEDDGRTPVTDETRRGVRSAAEALRQQGFEVIPFRPEGLEESRRFWWTLFGEAGGIILGRLTAGFESQLSPILREFRELTAQAPPLTAERLLDTWLARDQARIRLLAQMENIPILLCPVCSIPAFRHGEREWSIAGQTVGYLDAMSYTQWFNLLGNPAAVVPVGRSPEGLPIGVQIVGRPWEEAAVLQVAAALEEAFGWKQPPLSVASAGHGEARGA